jgi:RNA polymerase sigma-70 factor (ECF subfamily)
MTDKKVIDGIRAGGTSMQRAIDWFYKAHFGLVYNMSSTHHIDKELSIDAYSDAMTAFVDNIRDDKFRGESKCSTYFIRIFNNKCIDVIRKKTTNKAMMHTVSFEDLSYDMVQIADNKEEKPDIMKFVNELSSVCLEVLMDWSDGFSMDEVAERNNLKNAHTARSKRYNCFQQLMEILRKRNIVDTNFKLIHNGE